MSRTDLANETLRWTQPSALRSEYELYRGGERLGTLIFTSAFGSKATAQAAGGCWTFKRVGFLKTGVTIRSCGADTDVGVFENTTWSGGGTLHLARHRRLRADTNFWHSQYAFTDEADRPLVRYTTGGFLRMSGEMQILPAAAGIPELPWIVMLGWYLAIMMHRDDSSAGAVIAAM
jgi:hypothetical protein